MVFQFKIQIKGITKPPVWRKVAVPANFSFLRFHHIIQAAFGWENAHLFEFKDKEWDSNVRIALPVEDDFFDPGFFEEIRDASEVKLSDVFNDDSRKLVYVYDFGDNWVHEITLEATVDDKQENAVCLAAKGACPPEDCGGIYGYEGLKELFAAKPKGKAANQYREWLGMDKSELWDAKYFDIEEINSILKEI